MSDARSTVGKVMYAALFCAIVPGVLAVWAARLEPSVGLPIVRMPAVGASVLTVGLLIWAWGVGSLWVYGHGLPMNAFPPRELVTRGAFAWMNHPIYVGFVVMCGGAAIAAGSAAGLWLVTPLAALGCTALVYGYEDRALKERFPAVVRGTRLSLPPSANRQPTTWERLSVYVVVFGPWLILYETIGHVPVERPLSVLLPGEREWPVWVWAEAPYLSAYAFVGAVPLLIHRADVLRRFAVNGLVAVGLLHFLYVIVPVVSPPRSFEGSDLLADMLRWERADGLDGRAAFPAFHVLWVMLAARAYSSAGLARGVIAWMWAAVIAVCCSLTGMHAVLDIVAAVAVYPLVVHAASIYDGLRRGAERLANSWREWRIGPVRVISYAVFPGAAALAGCVIGGAVAGPDAMPSIAIVTITALVGAALWGQFWVGTRTSLLRPFGYFGSILGAVIAILAVAWWRGGAASWQLAAAGAIAAPWVQGIGRLRCLVNGCCHGAPCDKGLGICCTHPRSRVVRLSGLGGRPIHPTPLYSILANVATGLLLLRLLRADVSLPIITGMYFILAGLARFVEESLRGEPHTPRYCGLRLYQWCAIAMLVIGMSVCACRTPAVIAPCDITAATWWVSCAIGALYALAMGVDFPESNRRFSRLA